MKKVWILEGFVSREHMEKELGGIVEMISKAKTKEEVDAVLEMEGMYKKVIEKNPEGHWTAWQGKTNYKQFCDCAKETLRNMRKEKMQWRVIEGAIEDEASTWVGYKIVKENNGVMRYLWATL